jgi:hypothetical protein
MTNQFDYLLKQMHSELISEAPITGDISSIAPKIVSKAEEAPMSGHWKLLKQQENIEKTVHDILKIVLPEKDNTYNPDIDTPEQLKAAIKDAIEEVTSKKGWAAKFLADRLANKELIGSVAFEVADKTLSSEAPITQKEMREQIKKATETFITPEGQKARIEQGLKKKASFSSEEFSTTTTYQLVPPNQRDLNKMSEEERNAYDAVVETGAEEESTGRELHDALKRAGVSVSQIERQLQKFIDNGILISAEKEKKDEADFDEKDSGEIPTIDDEESSSRFDDELADYEEYLK